MEKLNKDSSMKEYKSVFDKRLDKDLEEISRIITMAQEQKRMLLHMRLGEPEPLVQKSINLEEAKKVLIKHAKGCLKEIDAMDILIRNEYLVERISMENLVEILKWM